MSTQDTWSAWLDEHSPRLLLFARQQARAEGSVSPEDILQEALVRLWRRHQKTPPIAFAFREIRCVAIDSARSLDRRKLREEKAHQEEPDHWFSPQDLPLGSGKVEELLHELPHEQAETVVLKIWGGLTFAEIGETTDCPPPTAAGRYRTALEKLKHALQGTPAPNSPRKAISQ